MRTRTIASVLVSVCLGAVAAAAEELPFQHSVEVYRNGEDDVVAFTVRLEQPFLAEEFEKSNYLRLQSDDARAYLIYPKETRFSQKHAEFYGRLRGEGTVPLTLSYETVSENLDGTRLVRVREGTVEVTIPPRPAPGEAIGPRSIFLDWARKQNEYFARMLEYYPDESFFQYCLLQSKARYGVDPPPVRKRVVDVGALETDLYEFVTGSLAIQEALQWRTLSSAGKVSDYNRHISTLRPPDLQSLNYEALLKQRLERDKIEPQVHEVSRIVPADYYFLHFHSMKSLGELFDLSVDWGDSLLRLFTVGAQDNRVQAKLEDQLCLRRSGLEELFADQVIDEVVITGAEPFRLEGADVTMILRVRQPELFEKEAAAWLSDTQRRFPELESRDFNYRGHKVSARYTNDRIVSSFVARHEQYYVYSNSHRAVRQIIDAATGEQPNLHDSLDYRYITTILPPSAEPGSGYFFASEAFIKQTIGPAAKIAQKRRLQCFNNLVMQNNASLFYRLENGRSPSSLSDLVAGRFVDPEKIICPHGGAYAFDPESDTCTCSLHNRLRYLTPNVELTVLNVSADEAAEYERYKSRYDEFWRQMFDPIAVRIGVTERVTLETCVLPFANSGLYGALRDMLDDKPQPIGTSRIAPSAITSLVMVPGRERTARYLKLIPGISEAVQNDPTLTDLSWLGDRVSLHFCDGQTILELDPTRLRPLNMPLVGNTSTAQQAAVGALWMSVNLPVYATVDVENRDKAMRLLDQFSQQIFLNEGSFFELPTKLDAYRLPEYKQHTIHVLTGRIYAATVRLYIALVGDQLVLSTKPEILREVIDVSTAEKQPSPPLAHLLLRLNPRGLDRLRDEVELNWAEKSRLACHRNIISIYNLHRLYDAPLEQIPSLSEAKYGVRYFCPEHGEYRYDRDRNQVLCSVHGNREDSLLMQPQADQFSSFREFVQRLDEVVASLRFEQDALIATVNIQRRRQE